MSYKDLKPESYWIATTEGPSFPSIENDISADVAIIGGGLVGITTAYLLKKEGVKTVIIEANRIAEGTSGHTTAKITSQHVLIYNDIKKQLGKELAEQYARANEFAIKAIADIAEENNIQCDYIVQPAYVYTHQFEYIQKIADETEAASSLGISAHYLEEIPLPFKVKAAMRFDNQAMFHPRKYLLGLAAAISGDGCAIYENNRAVDIHEGKTCSIIMENGRKVSAPVIILASHYPFYDRHGLYFSRLYPERSYVLGIRTDSDFPDGMFITAEDPGKSLRYQPDENGKLILVGGEHHKTGHDSNTWNRYEKLKEFAQTVFTVKSIEYRWSAQDYTSADNIPYTGYLTADRKNILVATGFRKWGMTNGTASAFILKDLIVKGESPWQEIYSPSRTNIEGSVNNFFVENADVAAKLIGGQFKNVPKCTHLGCGLQWNEAESSWDCPCHGSRFAEDGNILEGPAIRPLEAEEADE
jgi:glycine/D-amino acid oxidase-like deaminating enzyme